MTLEIERGGTQHQQGRRRDLASCPSAVRFCRAAGNEAPTAVQREEEGAGERAQRGTDEVNDSLTRRKFLSRV